MWTLFPQLDEVFVARLSQLNTLGAQLTYMVEVYNRIEDEANRSYRGDLQEKIHEAAVGKLVSCNLTISQRGCIDDCFPGRMSV